MTHNMMQDYLDVASMASIVSSTKFSKAWGDSANFETKPAASASFAFKYFPADNM